MNSFKPLGPHARAVVAVLALAALGIVAGRVWLEDEPVVAPATKTTADSTIAEAPGEAVPPRERSIAVLPLTVHNTGRENAGLLADGIHDGLLTRLGRLHGLKVISRTSAMVYRGNARDPRDAARELDVAHLLTGELRLHGTQLQISLRMFDAATGAALWSRDHDIGISTAMIFRVQHETVHDVAAALGLALDATDSGLAPTDNLDAYRAVLRSRQYLRQQRLSAAAT